MLAPSGGGEREDCHRRRRGRRQNCLAIIQSDFQTDSRMRANLASVCVAGSEAGVGAEAGAATNSRKW